MTDNVRALRLDSPLVVESLQFAKAQISRERAAQCRNVSSRVDFSVKAATVQVSEALVVTLSIQLADGEDVKGVQVQWTSTPTSSSGPALARVQEWLKNEKGFNGLEANGAKLVLPRAACSFSASRKSSNHSEGAAALELDGLELDELRQRYLDTPPDPPLGIVVERELEAYRSGLAAQLEGRVGTEEQAAAPVLPTSFSWLTEAPACLDYVHHQGDCGACYMFAALDSLSDRHCINRKKTSTLGTVDHLSIQMGILCEPLGRQCAGGWADIGFNYTQLFGMNTEAEWPYERSCLSPTVCQFGSQCITPMDYECTDFFSASELDKIKTFEDALAQADNKCSGKAVIQKDACKTWASTTFGKSPSLVFLPGKAFCRNLSREFREFLLRPRSGAPTALNSLAKQQGSVHRTDAGGTSKARGGVAAGAGSLGDVGTSGNAVLAAASPAVLLSSPASPVGVAALSASVDNANRTVWATGDSNSTCCCEGFFSDNKQHRLSTFGDAWLQASAKCEAIPQLHACKAWADRTFGATPSAAFRPTQGLCSRVRAEFSAFARLPLVEEAALLTGGGEEYAALGVQQAGRGQWWWARRRRSRKSKTPEKRAERTTREEEKPEKRAERTSREEEKPEWSNTRPTPAPAGAADSAARRCDRSRCQRESRPHLLTAYHYIPNSKDKFKEELYQEGPFYTSFYVYEDFPWFFRFWPAQAYNRQWGQNLGGHAVVLIGWEASCVYHNGPSLLQLEDSTGLQGRAARHHAQSTTSRRRTSTAECWHLRNTWGRGWADEGYFRMKDDMLTGPEGAHVHIASAAGDGPKSRSG